MSDERKQAKPLPLPEAGDIGAKFTWVLFCFVAGSHLLVQMKPEDSTALLKAWKTAIEIGREVLFHVPCPDDPWHEFLFDSKRVTYIEVMDDAHGWPKHLAAAEAVERQALEQRARANDLQVVKPKIVTT